MKAPKTITIESLAEYTKHTEKLLKDAMADVTPFGGHWYRGTGNSSYDLKPSLFRHPTLKDIESLIKTESKMLDDFRRQSVLMPGELAGTAVDAELRTLFYMQHYGIPTRLLDWSNNPFIALYFALTSARPDDSPAGYSADAAVWVLNPIKWNRVALAHSSHNDNGALTSQEAGPAYGPRKLHLNGLADPLAIKTLNEQCACCLGISNNARMFAQRGVFTIFGRETEGMEIQFGKFKHLADSLVKFVIPKGKIAELLTLLLKLGYTDSVSYPDLHGLAMEIKRLSGYRL